MYKKYPIPSLRITPLSDQESLEQFISRLEHINKLTIQLLQTNSEEIDNDDFWADLKAVNDDMNSNSVKATFSNTKDGLNNENVYTQASLASELGNSSIKLSGIDDQKLTINGSNDDFSLTSDMDELPKDIAQASSIKYKVFANLVNKNSIRLPKLANITLEKIKSISTRLRDN